MPVPSIMIGFRLTMVRMCSFRVISATALIMGMGPIASTRSMRSAVLDQLPKLVGDEAFVGIASVVGRDHQRIADLAQFTLQNDQFFVASTNDGDHAISLAFQRHRGRIRHCGTNAATHHHNRAKVSDLRRFSQRPNHIQNVIASVQRIEHDGGLADRLHNNANRAVLRI